MYGHMMNANYIELAQEARLAFAMDHFYKNGLDMIAFVRHLDDILDLLTVASTDATSCNPSYSGG